MMNSFIFFLFGISGGEVLILLLLILLLFGPKKIPEIARLLGRGLSEVKKVQREINTEIHRYSEDIEREAREMDSTIKQYADTQDNNYHQKKERPENVDAENTTSKKVIRDSDNSSDHSKSYDIKPDITETERAEKPDGDESGSQSMEDDDLPYPYKRDNQEG